MTFLVPFGNQVSRRRTVLVTGATGVAGTALLPQLRRHRLVVLAHRRIAPGNVITAHGDVTRPGLGLPADRYRALARYVDVVVHAAAETDPLARPVPSGTMLGQHQVACQATASATCLASATGLTGDGTAVAG